MPNRIRRIVLAAVCGLTALAAGAQRPELSRGIRPDQLGFSELHSVYASSTGDLVAFGRDASLRGRLVAVRGDVQLLAELPPEEGAMIRQPGNTALGGIELSADRSLTAVILLYELDDTTPYWEQSEIRLLTVVLGPSGPVSRIEAKRLALTSRALKDPDPESRWRHPGGDSLDPEQKSDPPGLLSRVRIDPVDADGDGWRDLVVRSEGCVSIAKSERATGGTGACPEGFTPREATVRLFRFDPKDKRFEEPRPFSGSLPSLPESAALVLGSALEGAD